MINTDDDYFSNAAAADALAVRRGHVRGSQPYVDFVDHRLEEIYGKGHGVPETHGLEADDGAGANVGDVAVPRGGGGSRGALGGDGNMPGGGRSVRTDLGTIGYRTGRDGQPVITFPNDTVRADFQAGADACNMSLAEYALDQVAISDEMAQGRNPGLFREEETVTLR